MISKLFHRVSRSQRIYGVRQYTSSDNPLKKTLNVLANDMPSFLRLKDKSTVYPEHADVVIIGGGFIGSAIAYWLKKRTGEGLTVVVLEKDVTYKDSLYNVSLGMLSQHFSLPENIYLSQHSVDFLRNIKQNLGYDAEIQYIPTGSLILASEQYAPRLEKNVTLLNELGVRNKLLNAAEIKSRYPWMNTEDVKLGCMAREGEGTFNSWAFLRALIKKSRELGASYVNAEVTGFDIEKQKDLLMEGVTAGGYQRINRIFYKIKDQEEEYAIKFAICVLAAGDNSGKIASLAEVGTGHGILNKPLPIERRESDIYSIQEKATELGLNTPLVMDTTGLWLMRKGLGSSLLCGILPLLNDDTKNISKSDYLKKVIEPSLLNRVPSCNNTKIEKLTTEAYDCNVFDNTGVLGPHPYHSNLYIAAGFGKQGCQHAPGIGRATAELIIDNQYTTLDLTRFGFDRLLLDERTIDFNVY